MSRLKKMHVSAEARADENQHLLRKVTFRPPPVVNPLDGTLPNQSFFNRAPSGFSTPKPTLLQPKKLFRSSSVSRDSTSKPPVFSSSSSRAPVAPSNQTPVAPRKRGIMIDLTEPVNREKLNFKVNVLSENNKRRRLEHLNSHFDPHIGAYDESFGESPTKVAAKLNTPRKDGTFKSLLRKYSF